MSFSPFTGSVSWIALLTAATKNSYDPKLDPQATEDDVSNREAERLSASQDGFAPDVIDATWPVLAVGDYLTDGRAAFGYETSAGNGKGSTLVKLPATDLDSISEALDGIDIDRDIATLSPAECIRRTATREGSEVVFKLSLAKHSRQVAVPVAEWPDFLSYVAKLADSCPNAVAHYRNAVKVANEEAAKAAAKAANK